MLESFPVETPQAPRRRAPADELEGFISEEDAQRAQDTQGPQFVRAAHRAQPVWQAPAREAAQHTTPSRFHFDLSDFTLSNLSDGKLPKVDARGWPWVVTAAAAIAAALIVVVAMQWRGNAPAASASAPGASTFAADAASTFAAGAASTSTAGAASTSAAGAASTSAAGAATVDKTADKTADKPVQRATNAPAIAAPASRARPANAAPPNAARPPVASPRAERPSNPADVRSAPAAPVPVPSRGAAATAARTPIASPPPTMPAAPIAVSPQPLTALPAPASEPPPATTAAAAVGTSGTVAAVPRNVTGDEPAIRGVLNRYQAAYERLDASAAKDIWPSVNERALAKAFAGLESQSLTFDQCRVTAGTDSAFASCRGRASYVGRVGSRSEQTQNREWTFRLRKSGDEWHIDSVQLK